MHLYKAYVDVTGDTENKPMVIGGGTYAKSLKNIIAFGPEMPGHQITVSMVQMNLFLYQAWNRQCLCI